MTDVRSFKAAKAATSASQDGIEEILETISQSTAALRDARDFMKAIEQGIENATYFDHTTVARATRLLIEEAGRLAEIAMVNAGHRFAKHEARFLDEAEVAFYNCVRKTKAPMEARHE